MIKIGISADLERRILTGPCSNFDELVPLVDEVRSLLVRARDSAGEKPAHGVGYKAILGALREVLGDRLALPPAPTTAWIIRQVNRAREIGLDIDTLSRLATAAGHKYPRGVIELEYLLRAAPRILAEGNQSDTGSSGNAESLVTSGRSDPDG